MFNVRPYAKRYPLGRQFAYACGIPLGQRRKPPRPKVRRIVRRN